MSVTALKTGGKPEPLGAEANIPMEFWTRCLASYALASEDATRFHIMGVLIEVMDGANVRITATNGHALSTVDVEAPGVAAMLVNKGWKTGNGSNRYAAWLGPDAEMSIKSLLKACPKFLAGLNMTVSEDRDRLLVSQFLITVPFDKPSFPDYESVFPKQGETVSVTFDAALLAKAVKAIGEKGKSGALQVTLRLDVSELNAGKYLKPFFLEGPQGRSAVIMPMRR